MARPPRCRLVGDVAGAMGQERLAEEAASKTRQLAQQSSKGPSSLTYNRNPVVSVTSALCRQPCVLCLASSAPCCLPVRGACPESVPASDMQAQPQTRVCDADGARSRGLTCAPRGQVCYYNIPVTEFATKADLRYAARVVNHAACHDPRDRVWSNVVANAITASCWVT